MRWWTPERFAARRGFLEQRAILLARVRAFFTRRNFLEVETPALQVSPGIEPHINVFATTLVEPFAQTGRPLYLHTSPEFAMKKLLAAGLPRIFQIARAYRNGERSPLHHPEFTILEWYRADADYRTLMDECEALVREVLAGRCCTRQGRTCNPQAPWQRLTVAQAFAERTGIDLLATLTDDSPDPDPAPLAAAAGLPLQPLDRWEDVFFRLMLERIEPFLGDERPVILYDYPAPLAALSCPTPADPRLAERFEVYICGVELANACSELTDPACQRRRFVQDLALRRRLYGTEVPIDEDLLEALSHMPPAAGIALGLDRLVMLAVGAERIEDVLWAPVSG